MAELTFRSVLQEITCSVKDETFSAMYFGRHCGKNILILKHHVSIMLVFEDDIQWSKPTLIKSVAVRGNTADEIQIVGNEDVILMFDEPGNVWRLINSFGFSSEGLESLHSLTNESYFEWVPFKKFNCTKVLAICAINQGFACIGVNEKLEKKLVVLTSIDLPLEEITFDIINSADVFSYHLAYLKVDIENSVLRNKLDSRKEALLITDRLKGETYLCTRSGKNCLIYQSNIYLKSALHYAQEKCVILCYESGKLVFYFYNEPERHCVVYLPQKIFVIEKCCCLDLCLLQSDGINLYHTKFTIQPGYSHVKLSNLKLSCVVQSPVSFLPVYQSILIATINNIYYTIRAGSVPGTQIKRNPREFLSDINKSSLKVDELEQNIDMLSHYLYCKDIMESCDMGKKVKMNWEGDSLVIKSLLGIQLKHKFWRLRLKMKVQDKEVVHMVEFKYDVSEGMSIRVDNPFKSKGRVKVSLIGDFGGAGLFLYLGEVGKLNNIIEKNSLSKGLEDILSKRNPAYVKK